MKVLYPKMNIHQVIDLLMAGVLADDVYITREEYFDANTRMHNYVYLGSKRGIYVMWSSQAPLSAEDINATDWIMCTKN